MNNFLILSFQGYIFKFRSYKYEVLVQYHGHISLLFIIYNFIIYYSKMGYFRSISMNVKCEFIAMLNVLVKWIYNYFGNCYSYLADIIFRQQREILRIVEKTVGIWFWNH